MDFNNPTLLKQLAEDRESRILALMDLDLSIDEGFKERIEQINCDIQKVHLLAVSIADVFWEEVYERQKRGEKGSKIGIRVRLREYATEISYYKESFTVKNGKSNFRKGLYIKKSSENKYLERDIAKLYGWEKELIREMEKSFAYCRAMSKSLVDARRQLRRAHAQLVNMV
ncbi:conjugative transfer protein MobI(A/C) [Halomonas sp. 3F2F]|uniref:conjugative transfer protein MobI(A/C) n=1 Tax=Halomonas sp. 3F2F TaxID=1255602 RepID=UPI001866FD34|nr:conjugative transfer protein MobI(A/C) [Halomonas sp. 3F2F]